MGHAPDQILHDAKSVWELYGWEVIVRPSMSVVTLSYNVYSTMYLSPILQIYFCITLQLYSILQRSIQASEKHLHFLFICCTSCVHV